MGPAEVKALQGDALARIDAAGDLAALDALRIEWIGRRGGRITALMKAIPSVAPEERSAFGQAVNALKAAVQDRLDARKAALAKLRLHLELDLPSDPDKKDEKKKEKQEHKLR